MMNHTFEDFVREEIIKRSLDDQHAIDFRAGAEFMYTTVRKYCIQLCNPKNNLVEYFIPCEVFELLDENGNIKN